MSNNIKNFEGKNFIYCGVCKQVYMMCECGTSMCNVGKDKCKKCKDTWNSHINFDYSKVSELFSCDEKQNLIDSVENFWKTFK